MRAHFCVNCHWTLLESKSTTIPETPQYSWYLRPLSIVGRFVTYDEKRYLLAYADEVEIQGQKSAYNVRLTLYAPGKKCSPEKNYFDESFRTLIFVLSCMGSFHT